MGLQNKLTDLNNILFEQLEILNDDEFIAQDSNLSRECSRARAMTDVGKVIISNAQLVLDATKHADEYGYNSVQRDKRSMPRILGVDGSEK